VRERQKLVLVPRASLGSGDLPGLVIDLAPWQVLRTPQAESRPPRARKSALLARTGVLLSAAGGPGEGERSVIDDALHDDGGGEPLHAGQGGERLVA